MILLAAALCAYGATPEKPTRIDLEQVPSWSAQDMAFFLHGSMSAEVVPEGVLRAFIKTYLDLFPASDLSHLGLLPDPTFGWPIGLSRANVKHLGGLSAIGINCASCHVTQITSTSTNQSSRILGVTSHFDVEKFFGSALAGTFKTADPANMKKFLAIYLNADPQALDAAWQNQEQKILATMKDDPFGAKGIGPGELHKLDNADVQQSFVADTDLAARAHSLLKLFHNMRAALHIPDQPPSSAEAAAGTPEQAPPSSGPGATTLSVFSPPACCACLSLIRQSNLDWSGTWRNALGCIGTQNTKSPIARNLPASLGLGAPMHGRRADLVFADVKRQTDLTEKIRSPRYPFRIDGEAAKRGALLFEANCNSCHGGPESDKRLYSIDEVGTDPHRAKMFTQKLADAFNKFLAELETEGYQPPKEPGMRSTGKYFARH